MLDLVVNDVFVFHLSSVITVELSLRVTLQCLHSVIHKNVLIKVSLLLLQANLKADSTTKTLLQRCQDLVKIIDEYPTKVLLTLPPVSRLCTLMYLL